MAISKYIDAKDGKEYFKVRVVKKSSSKSGTHEPVAVEKRALQIKTLAEAEKIEKKLNLEAQREVIKLEEAQMKWGTLVMEWYEASWKGDIFSRTLSKTAIGDYLSILREHTWQWHGLRVDELDKAIVWRTLEKVENDVSIVRRKKVRTAVDAVFKWGMLSGRIKGTLSLPTEGFKTNKREEEKLPEILTLEEIKALLKAAKQLNHEWYPIWAMALLTGMRSGELYALEWPAIDFEGKMIYVHRNWTNKEGFGPTKARYWRAVPMSDHLETLLKELRLKSKDQVSVLPRHQAWTDGEQANVLRTFCGGVGIPSVKFHTLRACFATQLIKDGVAPAVIMKMAGWKDLKTMQRYIRLAGIEVKGATDGLKLLPDEEVMGRVIELFAD